MKLTQFKYHIATLHRTGLFCVTRDNTRLAESTKCHQNEGMIGSPTLLSTGNQEAPQCWNKHLGWIHSLPQSGPMSTPVQGALENLLGLRSSN